MDAETLPRLAYLGLLLAALAGWLFVEFRGRMGLALRTGFAWGMIFIGVMAGYGLWQDIGLDLRPKASVMESGDISIPRAADGHYYLDLVVNGVPVAFMADTGATNIVLTAEDARRLGFSPESLTYLSEARTANGSVRIAHVTLDSMELGRFRDQRISAWVNGGEMDISLLGMDYLGQFRIEIDRNEMILRR